MANASIDSVRLRTKQVVSSRVGDMAFDALERGLTKAPSSQRNLRRPHVVPQLTASASMHSALAWPNRRDESSFMEMSAVPPISIHFENGLHSRVDEHIHKEVSDWLEHDSSWRSLICKMP